MKNKQYISHGETYSLGQHGFARDMEFILVSQTEDELIVELQNMSSEKPDNEKQEASIISDRGFLFYAAILT